MVNRLSQPTVLIVDDSEVYCYMASLACKAAGALECQDVQTVHDALEIIRQNPPQACLLDVHLGTELSLPVAELLSRKSVPFAICSGNTPPGKFAEFAARNVVLTKPAPFDELVKTVRLLLSKSVKDAA